MTALDSSTSVGRPREFDADAVLAVVVDLFWEKGFGATSVGDVVDRTGLSKSSIYGAFGSKDELYRAALARYLDDHRAMVDETLRHGTRGLADVDAFLDRIRAQVEQQRESRGCLAVNTSTELGSAEPSLVEFGTRHREFLREGFLAALERAAAAGEIDRERPETDANVLVSVVLGMAVMVRGGASPAEVGTHLDAVQQSLRR